MLKVITSAAVRERRFGVQGQSAFNTQKPSRGRQAASSPFSAATPSMVCSPSR